ncbi:MAG TPA: hypothetical protein VJU86_00320 [Pyrinomonadaceae bacterium]|nr:hypothetical protein [Pyrinomonadaceae bacterium]
MRSGSEQTYTKGKDTGNYWDAGAVNVHWVIATDTQVNEGVQEALARVQSEIVFIEGNSFTQYIDPDFFIMVIRRDRMTIKKTARNAMNRVSAIYVSGTHDAPIEAEFEELSGVNMSSDIPVFSSQTFSMLVERIQNNLHRARQTKPFRAAS